jgi:hypothetical protein
MFSTVYQRTFLFDSANLLFISAGLNAEIKFHEAITDFIFAAKIS